jgi:hypothetical protein
MVAMHLLSQYFSYMMVAMFNSEGSQECLELILQWWKYNGVRHTAIENLSDPIGYLLDFTNPYNTALAGNMKARAKKDNSFWNHT